MWSHGHSSGKQDHTLAKRFQCTYCPNRFNAKYSLKRHALIHDGIKPYVCSHGQKGFTLKQYLIEHEHTHTG